MIKKNVARIYLFGGLGNVLFQIAFAKFVSGKRGIRVRLIQVGRFEFEGLLKELIQGDWCQVITQSKIPLKLLSIIYKSLARIQRKKYFVDINPTERSSKSVPEFNFQTYFGYFQQLEFATYAMAELESTIIKNVKSDWYFENARKIQLDQAVGVHIRRGDFIGASSYHGLLNEIYYQNALDQIPEIKSIWVFSDDLVLARELFEKIEVSCKIHYVNPPSDVAPIESLLLLSLASCQIIANSTFSWWAALMSHNSKMVIYPKQWLLSQPNFVFSFPGRWQGIDSAWDKRT